MLSVQKTKEYQIWEDTLTFKHRMLVDARIERLKSTGTFGLVKHIQGPLLELKWKQGIRVYLARTGELEYTLLLGGTKHGQDRDIKKAKAIIGL